MTESAKLPLWRIFALCAVGLAIDLGYAVEGAYAAPLMMDAGLPLALTSIAFIPSPILSLLTQLLIGSISDNCTCSWGRRRPFIVLFCIMFLVSLAVAPNALYLLKLHLPPVAVTVIVVTFIVIFDYSLNVLRVPSRAYVLDVLPISQSQLGSFIYSAMIGIGATLGFILGGIDWAGLFKMEVSIRHQCQIVFGLVAVITFFCMMVNIFSVKETPYKPNESTETTPLKPSSDNRETTFNDDGSEDFSDPALADARDDYIIDGTDNDINSTNNHSTRKPYTYSMSNSKSHRTESTAKKGCCSCSLTDSVKKAFVESVEFLYYMSGYMWLLLLFTFLVSVLNAYENFFTVFVGRGVYHGDAVAPEGSMSLLRYNTGVRIGSWGLAIAAASDVATSLSLNHVTRFFRLKTVFLLILVLCTLSMVMMMAFHRIEVVLSLSVFYGPMLGLAVTIPYALVPLYEVSCQLHC